MARVRVRVRDRVRVRVRVRITSPDASQCDALSKARLTRVSSRLAKPQPVMMAAC